MKGEIDITRTLTRRSKRQSRKEIFGNFSKKREKTLKIATALAPVLEQIGVPEASEFVPDPFQLKAISLLEKTDVIVTAPTGAGKTWIAEKAIERVFKSGGRCWYACPLKALSNSIYSEFGKIFGQENLGILTGDRKENPNAPIIVGTTEILRNQLYDAMSEGEDLPVDLVVLDEAHYIGDEERGVVWEEVLIYLPTRVRLLLLSATIHNAKQIADWLTWLRSVPCDLVSVDERPVPIFPLFLFPEGELYPLNGKKGVLPIIAKKSSQYHRRRHRRTSFPSVAQILNYLEQANLLPAIFFFKSRSDCDRAVEQCLWALQKGDLEKEPMDYEFSSELLRFLENKSFLKNHRQLQALVEARVGAHHGGQLPIWKVLLETMMKKGHLKAIFSTSTVAAGVNFPARTVVLFQSDRFNGEGFVELTSTELLQMTGRAGRRGMDKIGFVLLYPGPYQRPDVIYDLLKSPPGSVESQIKVNFSMVLNLLLSHKPAEVMEVFANSLATYQSIAAQGDLLEKRDRIRQKIETLLVNARCKTFDELMLLRDKYKNTERDLEILTNEIAKESKLMALEPLVKPGAIFRTAKGDVFVVVRKEQVRGRDGIRCWRVTPILEGKSSKVRSYWVRLEKVTGILDAKVEIPEEIGRLFPEPWMKIVKHVCETGTFKGVEELEPDETNERWKELNEKASEVKDLLNKFPCNGCNLRMTCVEGRRSKLRKLIKKSMVYENQLHAIQYYLWKEFQRHLELLKAEGYVSKDGELTSDGIWASRLRLDQPLLVSECIRTNVFPDNDPVLLSALMAPFVNDRRTDKAGDYATYKANGKLYRRFLKLTKKLNPLIRRLNKEGFPCSPLSFWPALTIYLWASGESWDETRLECGIDEGDLAMLIFRTADNLRQLTALADTHPELANCAEEAINLLLREPISYD
ncbi:MAG TPA: DEAD/DEAH box helicase [Deltaproteobacteria bacterium]|nr:DEAD/DEAH box helicase [Deltaproteobacteria bacterium]